MYGELDQWTLQTLDRKLAGLQGCVECGVFERVAACIDCILCLVAYHVNFISRLNMTQWSGCIVGVLVRHIVCRTDTMSKSLRAGDSDSANSSGCMLPPIVYAFFGTCQEPSTAGHHKTPENSLFLGCRCFFPWAEITAILVYALTLACQLANCCFLPSHIGTWHPFAVESFKPSVGIRCPCISWHWRTCEPFNWWGRNAQGRWCQKRCWNLW